MDNNRVIKIKTVASGPFVFSWLYSEEQIKPLLIEADVLYRTMSDLPILPSMFSQLNEDIIRKSIFGTAALEGNPLDEERVGEILSTPDKIKSSERAEQEIINLKKAYNYIREVDIKQKVFVPKEKGIKAIHSDVTSGIEYENNIPGTYRDVKVKVGDREHGGTYTPPKCYKDIQLLMEKYIEFINSEEINALHPFLRAAIAHYHFSKIHPFGDGNGRTARIIEACLLHSAEIKFVPPLLSNYYYTNIDEYYWAFSLSNKHTNHEITPFLIFVLKGIIESLEELKEKITQGIRILSLRYYSIELRRDKILSQRQYDFIDMLINNPADFTINDLFSMSPYNVLFREISTRTVKRDIKKLLDMNLIVVQESGKYCINYRALG